MRQTVLILRVYSLPGECVYRHRHQGDPINLLPFFPNGEIRLKSIILRQQACACSSERNVLFRVLVSSFFQFSVEMVCLARAY
jgi:hypothetical protein